MFNLIVRKVVLAFCTNFTIQTERKSWRIKFFILDKKTSDKIEFANFSITDFKV